MKRISLLTKLRKPIQQYSIADLKRDLSQLKSIVKYYREIHDVGQNPE